MKGVAPRRKTESTRRKSNAIWDEKFCFNCIARDRMESRARSWPICRKCLDQLLAGKGKRKING